MDWTLTQNRIKHDHHADCDRLFWSNQHTPKNKWLLIGYVVTLSLLLLVLGPSIRWLVISRLNDLGTFDKFSFIVYTMMWGYFFLQMSKSSLSFWRQEQIKITNDEIVFAQLGPFASKPIRIPNQELEQLSFQKYPSGNFEPYPSLNLVYKRDGDDNKKRVQVAKWMRKKEKHDLFLFLQMLLEKRAWTIEFVDEYSSR